MKFNLCLFAVAAIALSSILYFARPTEAQSEPHRIEVTAKRFEFTPDEATVKKGEPVVIEIKAMDATHGMTFPDFKVQTTANKGQANELSFTPDKSGDFIGQCAVFCGAGHGNMKFTLHVTE